MSPSVRARQAGTVAKQAATVAASYAGAKAAEHGRAGAERAQAETLRPVRSVWDDAWAVVGYSLLLILLYWLVNRRVSGLGKLWEVSGSAARAWMSPTADPLAHVERALGHTTTAAGASTTAPTPPGASSSTGGNYAPPPNIAGRVFGPLVSPLPGEGFSQAEAERLGITPRRPQAHHARRRRARIITSNHRFPIA